MHRIDTPTAQVDKFGAGKNGFTRGNPQTGTPATDLDDDYFDMLQEELVGIVEAAGLSLDKTKHNQLRTALPLFLELGTASKKNIGTGTGQIPDMSSFTSTINWFKLPSGHIVQMFEAVAGQNGASISTNYPIPFPSNAIAFACTPIVSDPNISVVSNGGSKTAIALSSNYASSSITTRVLAIGY